MTKPATADELRTVLKDVLWRYEGSFRTIVAMLEILNEYHFPIERVTERAQSERIHALVHPSFAPLIEAIDSEDLEALQRDLQRMHMPPWKM